MWAEGELRKKRSLFFLSFFSPWEEKPGRHTWRAGIFPGLPYCQGQHSGGRDIREGAFGKEKGFREGPKRGVSLFLPALP
jgi:hypothetical protein